VEVKKLRRIRFLNRPVFNSLTVYSIRLQIMGVFFVCLFIGFTSAPSPPVLSNTFELRQNASFFQFVPVRFVGVLGCDFSPLTV
jgi:hypothetical protein